MLRRQIDILQGNAPLTLRLRHTHEGKYWEANVTDVDTVFQQYLGLDVINLSQNLFLLRIGGPTVPAPSTQAQEKPTSAHLSSQQVACQVIQLYEFVASPSPRLCHSASCADNIFWDKPCQSGKNTCGETLLVENWDRIPDVLYY